MPDPHDDLTAAEAEALAQLPGSEQPPAHLADEIVMELKRTGLIAAAPGRPARASTLRWAGAAAAALAIFLSGLLAGIYLPRAPLGVNASVASGAVTPAGRHFVLLLYEDDAYQEPADAAAAERVEEYRRWGQALARGGHLVDGIKLKNESQLIPASSAGTQEGLGLLAGYFILAARDGSEALALAADCPHLKYHGRIVVREVDPV